MDGNLFPINRCINCEISLVGCKNSIYFILNSTIIFQRKVRGKKLCQAARLLMTYCLHAVELLCSNLCTENSDAGHIECSCGPQIPPHLRIKACRKWPDSRRWNN